MRSFSEEPLRIESTKFTFLRLKGTRHEERKKWGTCLQGGGVTSSVPPTNIWIYICQK